MRGQWRFVTMQQMDFDDQRIELAGGAPTAEEAAAAIAVLEALLRDTAGVSTPAPRQADRWLQTALLEGVEPGAGGDAREPWIKTQKTISF